MGNCFSVSLSCDTLVTRCSDCIAGQCQFVCALKENISALETQVQDLKDRKDDVIRRVIIAEEQQQLQRLKIVEGWLSRTEAVTNDADLLITESSQQINQLCMGGGCSRHPKSSYNFGKQIAKKLQEVRDQLSSGNFSIVADKAPLPSLTKRPSEPTVGLETTFNKVWSNLEEEHVGIIGLYGLGGVGKTTLLNQINDRLSDAPPNGFDYVIWVVVSQDVQIEKIQEEIGKRMGFSDEAWKRKRLDHKAEDIFNVLRKKKFALLLDDIWERVELTRVGVPLPTQENNSKVIFTTRSIDVCSQMEANKKIKVECLPQEEALKLFEKKVGAETLNSHPKIRELAEAVVEECGGLPLALITIGRAMASKQTPQEWEYAKEVLRQSVASVFPGVGKEMYPKLKFSYSCLSDEKVKSCFLYCSLYPEDFLIPKDDLIECWIGEELLDHEHCNYSSVRNQGHFTIRCLVDACLLEEEKYEFVKMHDVIRDMALWIADEDFFVKAGVQLKEVPAKGKWGNSRKVSLMDNQIEDLSEIPACPNLQTLLLGKNELKFIGTDFFNSMPMLKVLDLSENGDLEELPIGIANLVSLEHLNMSYTSIRELPIELKALQKLKYLNLEWTYNPLKIPEQLISSFSKLQVLKMRCRGVEWSVEEIEQLKDLEVLTITFKTASMLGRALKLNKFKNCYVKGLVLCDFRGSILLNILSLLNLRNLYELLVIYCEDVEEVKMECARGIESAGRFQSLRHVRLVMCSKLKDASWVIFAPHLERLDIESCTDLEEIISEEKLGAKQMENSNLFSQLQTLYLYNLRKLKTIYGDALPFPLLKKIRIQTCPMLKKLPLSSVSAKGQHREILVIEGQNKWWEDLEWEDESTRIAFLPFFKPL